MRLKHPALVADEQSLTRAGLASLLRQQIGFQKVLEAYDFAGLVSMLTRHPNVELATFDYQLPGLSGVSGIRQLRSRFPLVRLIVIDGYMTRELVLELLAAGVHGSIPKSLGTSDIVAAYKTIILGQIYVPPLICEVSQGQRQSKVDPDVPPELTLRQYEILELITSGKTNKEVARSLSIAEGTVKVHVQAAFRVLGVRNRTEAAAAIQNRRHGELQRTDSIKQD